VHAEQLATLQQRNGVDRPIQPQPAARDRDVHLSAFEGIRSGGAGPAWRASHPAAHGRDRGHPGKWV